jgi:hypothetical protein
MKPVNLTLISKANSSLLFHGVFAVLQVSGQNFIFRKSPRFNQRRINQNLIRDRPVMFVHGSLGKLVIFTIQILQFQKLMICSYYKSSRHRCENNIVVGTVSGMV